MPKQGATKTNSKTQTVFIYEKPGVFSDDHESANFSCWF